MSDQKSLGRWNLTAKQFLVCLSRIKGYSQTRIGKELGISQPRVNQHIAAAVKKYPHLAEAMKYRGRMLAA